MTHQRIRNRAVFFGLIALIFISALITLPESQAFMAGPGSCGTTCMYSGGYPSQMFMPFYNTPFYPSYPMNYYHPTPYQSPFMTGQMPYAYGPSIWRGPSRGGPFQGGQGGFPSGNPYDPVGYPGTWSGGAF